jgi:hypothetical protein
VWISFERVFVSDNLPEKSGMADIVDLRYSNYEIRLNNIPSHTASRGMLAQAHLSILHTITDLGRAIRKFRCPLPHVLVFFSQCAANPLPHWTNQHARKCDFETYTSIHPHWERLPFFFVHPIQIPSRLRSWWLAGSFPCDPSANRNTQFDADSYCGVSL